MKKWAVAAMGLFLFLGNSAWGQDMEATTNDGRAVILMENHTWRFAETSSGGSAPSEPYKIPASSTRLVRSTRGDFGVWLDSSKWRIQRRKQSPDTMFEFQHKNGDAYAMVIAERITVPLKALRQVAIDNVKSVGKKTRVVREEKRMVNGHEVLLMKITTVIQFIPFVYYNYYYTGKIGSIQIITYTGANLFEEYKADFEDLLNGFVILGKRR